MNIQSINKKFNDLEICLHNHRAKIVCLTETWARKNELAVRKIQEYKYVTSFNRTLTHGGGCAIWSQPDLNIDPIDVSNFSVEKNFEVCAAMLNYKSAKIIILNIYRSPSGNYNNFVLALNAILEFLYNPGHYIILTGDFNINCIHINETYLQSGPARIDDGLDLKINLLFAIIYRMCPGMMFTMAPLRRINLIYLCLF